MDEKRTILEEYLIMTIPYKMHKNLLDLYDQEHKNNRVIMAYSRWKTLAIARQRRSETCASNRNIWLHNIVPARIHQI